MAFEKDLKTLLIKSNKNISEISFSEGISINNYNDKFNLLSNKKIISGSQGFADCYFDIDINDSIYGLINTKKGGLLYIYCNDNSLSSTEIFKFNGRRNFVKFPYIKKLLDNTIHLFFYLGDATKTNYCTLFHYYHDGLKWHKTAITNLNYFLLTNFSVIWNDNIPTIFFLKKVNKFSEIFMSSYNLQDKSWSKCVPITKTKKEKVYLSIIKTSNNTYHFSYAEANNNKYFCMYFSEDKNNLTSTSHKYIHLNVNPVCSFPNLLIRNKTLYLQWIEGTSLFTCKSKDLGFTWTDPIEKKSAEFKPFYRCQYNKNSKTVSVPYIFYSFNNSLTPII